VVDGWGVGELWTRGAAVVQHELPSPKLEGRATPGAPRLVDDLCGRFSLHLEGQPVGYEDVVLDVEWATSFQQALVASLRAVPWGEVVTYGELAALAGRPGAARAAGSLCAGNRFSLIVPCHRVVAAGGIGGYGASGVQLKRRLLALEGVRL
jgi:O-6-methylguanine DNA methyltransferase